MCTSGGRPYVHIEPCAWGCGSRSAQTPRRCVAGSRPPAGPPRLSLSPADDKYSASEASNFSSITSAAYLPTADDLNLRRPSAASEISVTSTIASVLSAGGRPPILTINSPSQVFRTPTWANIEEWTKQTIHDDNPQKQGTPASSNQHDSL